MIYKFCAVMAKLYTIENAVDIIQHSIFLYILYNHSIFEWLTSARKVVLTLEFDIEQKTMNLKCGKKSIKMILLCLFPTL